MPSALLRFEHRAEGLAARRIALNAHLRQPAYGTVAIATADQRCHWWTPFRQRHVNERAANRHDCITVASRLETAKLQPLD